MDDASTDLLLRLARSGSARRQAMLVTHSRPDTVWSPTDDESLWRLSLTLVPLPMGRAAEIVEHVTEDEPMAPHVVDEIARRSGGNALFLLELIDLVRESGSIDSLPSSVESIIAGEIDRLSPSDRTVLRYASVLGTSFDTRLLEAAVLEEAELDGGIWGRLAGLVDPGGDGFMRFRNTLVRDAAYEGLPYRRRRELHNRVGQVIEASAGTSLEEIGTLALHFHEAQRWDKAWEYGRRAGERAMEIYATSKRPGFSSAPCLPRGTCARTRPRSWGASTRSSVTCTSVWVNSSARGLLSAPVGVQHRRIPWSGHGSCSRRRRGVPDRSLHTGGAMDQEGPTRNRGSRR